MGTQNKQKELIAKLLQKAKNTTNVQEAETFMAKVNELLSKYNLNLDEVEALDINDKGLIMETEFMTHIMMHYKKGFEYILFGTSSFFYVICAEAPFFHQAKFPIYGICSRNELNIKTYIDTMEIIYNATVAEFENKNDVSTMDFDQIEKKFKYFCIGISKTLIERLLKEQYKDEEGNDITRTLVTMREAEHNKIIDALEAEGMIDKKEVKAMDTDIVDGADLIDMIRGMAAGDRIPIKDSKRLD